jgi:hypothetical protein
MIVAVPERRRIPAAIGVRSPIFDITLCSVSADAASCAERNIDSTIGTAMILQNINPMPMVWKKRETEYNLNSSRKCNILAYAKENT